MAGLLEEMRNYTELLTEQEVDKIVSAYLNTNGDPQRVKEILDLLSFYIECKIIADGVLSGDLVVTGADENGLKFRASEKELKKLH